MKLILSRHELISRGRDSMTKVGELDVHELGGNYYIIMFILNRVSSIFNTFFI